MDTLADESDGDFSAGDLSLREAVFLANSNADANTITFAPALSGGTLTLTRDEFTLSTDVTIAGPGANQLTIDAGGNSRHFEVESGVTAGIAGLTLTGGSALDGGSIFNSGTLTVAASTLSGNAARFFGGAIDNYAGTLTVTGSTLSGNAAGDDGGAIHSDGTLTVTGGTLSGNAAGGVGGAIQNLDGAATLRNVTLTGNRADADGNGTGTGGGVFTSTFGTTVSTTLHNSLVAGNARGAAGAETPDEFAGRNPEAASPHNLVGDAATSGGLTAGANGNLVGYLASEVIDTALADNGGPTRTHALLAGSVAVNAGSDAEAAGTADQRGVEYVGTADIGAYEFADFTESLLVTTLADEDDGTSDATVGAGTSLREAIAFANSDPDADTITFAPALSGGTLTLALGEFTLSTDMTIAGLGADALTIDADGLSRHFTVNADVTAEIAELTLTGGDAFFGGSIFNYGALTVTGSTLSGNTARGDGGAIRNRNGTLTVTGSTLSGNTARGEGGAIDNHEGALTVTGSTLSGNTARGDGGAIYNYAYSGTATATVTGSTLSDNTADVNGGAIANGSFYGSVALTLRNATLAGNRADADGIGGGVGGGVLADGRTSTTLHNSLVAGNARGAAGAETPDEFGGRNPEAASPHNLIGDAATAGGLTDGANGNLVGYLASEVIDTALADNGGPTETHALLRGSAAVDAGSDAEAAGPTDQRGLPRVLGAAVDIGAVEAVPETLTVDTLADGIDGDVSAGNLSLREAVLLANADADANTVAFAPALSGGTVTLTAGELALTADVTLAGPGAFSLAIDGGGSSRLFRVAAGVTAGISGLSLTGGRATGSSGTRGGAVLNAGTLTLADLSVRGNRADAGGAVYAEDGAATGIVRGEFLRNAAADRGGAVRNGDGTLTVVGAGFAFNTADGLGGGVLHNAGGTAAFTSAALAQNLAGGPTGSGGAILTAGGSLTVRGGVLAFNGAARAGGAIEAAADGPTTVTIADVSVRNNAATGGGAGASGNGGAVHVTDPAGDVAVTVTRGEFLRNGAATGGGALRNGGGTMTVEGTGFAGNVALGPAADDGGGAIFNAGGALAVGHAVFFQNSARGPLGGGGALFTAGGTLTVRASRFGDNAARRAGGAIGVAPGPGGAATVTLTDVLLTGNLAGRPGPGNPGNGGGLHVAGPGAEVSVLRGVNDRNVAANRGGAFWNADGGTLTLDRTRVTRNRAGAAGGGLYAEAAATTVLIDAVFAGNAPGDFGGPGPVTCA